MGLSRCEIGLPTMDRLVSIQHDNCACAPILPLLMKPMDRLELYSTLNTSIIFPKTGLLSAVNCAAANPPRLVPARAHITAGLQGYKCTHLKWITSMLLLFSLLTVATDNSCFNLRITIGGLVLVRFARDHPQGSSPSPAQCNQCSQCTSVGQMWMQMRRWWCNMQMLVAHTSRKPPPPPTHSLLIC